MLVAVVNDPADLLTAQREGWYRIPLNRAPTAIGADFLALYQTAAFPPDERWAVRWIAPVRGYHLATRRELLPAQPDHPRAGDRYYRVDLGELARLAQPVPSRRLRRITFIRTTLGRLLAAEEINDLWIKSAATERLWTAIKQAGLADRVEREYPLLDNLPYTADFALLADTEAAASTALLIDEGRADLSDCIRERAGLDYPLAAGGWRAIFVNPAEPGWIERCLRTLRALQPNSPNS